MRIRRALAAIAVGAALALGAAAAPAVAATPVPSSSGPTVQAGYTWQYTGESFKAKSACDARASYFLAASNVKYYRCVSEGGRWAGQVYAS
ncbi:hypothetical protein [Streptomyces sp. XY431]|uniref:hypothetical protein n=1 Tax=Streptomyces sp. XY431 TaxID=1415562 RepID=UPI000B320055|nr:hypothetical protein [Streptomyces sp. XY431]